MSTTLNLNHFDQGDRWALGIRGFTFHPMFFDRNYTGFLKPKENNPFSIPPLYKDVRTFDPSWLYGQVELTKSARKRQYARVIHSKQNANSFKLKPDVDYHVGNQSAHLWINNQGTWTPKNFTISWWHSPLGDGPFYMGDAGVDRGYFGIPTSDYEADNPTIAYYEHSFYPIYFSNNIPLYDQALPYQQTCRYGTYIYINGKAYEFEPPETRNGLGTFDGTDFYPNSLSGDFNCHHTVLVKGVHVVSRTTALLVVNVLSFFQYASLNSEGFNHPLEDYMDFWNRLYVLKIDLKTKSPQGNLTTQYVKMAGSSDKWIKNYEARLKVISLDLTGFEEGDTYEDNLWGQWPARFNRSGTEFSMIWSHITHDFQLIDAHLTDVTTHEVLVTTWRVVENAGVYTIENQNEDSYKYIENQISNYYNKVETHDGTGFLTAVTVEGYSEVVTNGSQNKLPIALNYDIDTLKVAFIYANLSRNNTYSSSWTYSASSSFDLSDFSSYANEETSRFFIKIDNSEFPLMLNAADTYSYVAESSDDRFIDALDSEYQMPHKMNTATTNGNVSLDLIYIDVVDKVVAKGGIINDTTSYDSEIYFNFVSYPAINEFFDTLRTSKKGYGFINYGFDSNDTMTTTNFDFEDHTNTNDYNFADVEQVAPAETFPTSNYIAATEDTIPNWFYGRFYLTHFLYSAKTDKRLNPKRWMYSCMVMDNSNIANGLPPDITVPNVEWFNSSIPGVKTAVTNEYATQDYPNIIIGQIGLI